MEKCTICIENIENNKNTIKLDCNHLFHYDCLVHIKNNKCPNCRKTIINEPICENNHSNFFFYGGNIKKDGTCYVCLKKPFKNHLKEKFIENVEIIEKKQTKVKKRKKFLKIFYK